MIAPSESPKCAYQSGREFDDALLDQLDVLPEFVVACSFRATVRVHLNSSALWLRLLTTDDDDWLVYGPEEFVASTGRLASASTQKQDSS